ncbi:MAG: CDP-alcohol phosphatidyltransferase family protein [Methanobacteriaceae archaeon]|nr:CDP-alcohol phosphatidyltransferase family protein [Methanobacteriaceae archaeon]
MLKKSQIPSSITLIRLFIAPVIFYTILADEYILSAVLLIFAGFTDFLDGYLARKLDAASDKGAYLDVIIDFIMIIASFVAFVLKSWYDPLIVMLIITMFLIFIGTSSLKKPVYDPIGKYLGAYLMFMILFSLLFPLNLIREILLAILIVVCITSIISRFFRLFILNLRN